MTRGQQRLHLFVWVALTLAMAATIWAALTASEPATLSSRTGEPQSAASQSGAAADQEAR
ncbi:hypothetical protein GC169_04155 [bacterium]|nr:hypothetical protein [bacterium]